MTTKAATDLFILVWSKVRIQRVFYFTR